MFNGGLNVVSQIVRRAEAYEYFRNRKAPELRQ